MPSPVVSGQSRRGRLSHPADWAKTDETISGAEAPRTGSSKSARRRPQRLEPRLGLRSAPTSEDGRPDGRCLAGKV